MIEIIEKLKAAKGILTRDPPDDMKFRPSFELAQQEAKREIGPLTDKLIEAIAGVSVPVFVLGSTARKLSEQAIEETPSAVVDLNDIYQTLVDDVRQSIGRSQEFGVSQFVIVMRNLRGMAEKSGLHSIANVSFGEPLAIQSDEQLKRVVIEYANRIVGSDLAVNYVRKVAATQAAERVEEKVPVFPVFILNSTPELRAALGNKLFRKAKSIEIEAPAELTKDSALDMLESIKKTLKGNKK